MCNDKCELLCGVKAMEAIRNVFFACLLLQIVEYCMPNSNYQKYIKFYGGLVIIALLITPFMNWLMDTDWIDGLISRFENEKMAVSLQHDIALSEERTIEKIVEPYEKQIASHVEGVVKDKGLVLVRCSVSFDLDSSSSTYGSITGIEAKVKRKYEAVADINLEKDVPAQYKLQINNIKTELSNFYNLEEANINVSMK